MVALDGSVTLPHDVQFNGATLEHGTALRTATHFPRFLEITAAASRRIALGRGELSASAGLTFVALSFVLHGTLAPGSALHETSEDFLTQELPVPVGGLSLDWPLAGRFGLTADAGGGWLPRVNSLRREGGEVTLRQSHGLLGVGVRYDVNSSLRVTAGFAYATFTQHESSREDGNDIALATRTFGVRVGQRF